MIEIVIAFLVVYTIEEMARARRLNYKIWFSTAILGWLSSTLLRVFTPFPLAFLILGWLFLISMYLYLYAQKVPKKKLSERELNELFSKVQLGQSDDQIS